MGPLRRKRTALLAFSRVRAALFVFAACFAVLIAPALRSQTSTQQRVYGSGSVTTSTSMLPGFSKDSTTGSLTKLPGAPFPDRLAGGLVAIDGQGHFLFVLNVVSDNISMYQIDSSTGGLTEVPSSPFAAGPTVNPNLAPSLPISLATEKSGNFLYVGYANGDSNTTSALIPFSIDAANLRIVLTPQLSLDFANGTPIQMLTDPKGLRLYVGFGPGLNQSSPAAGTIVYSIDASNGVLTAAGNAGGGSDAGRAIAMDAKGRFFFDAWGQTDGFLDSGIISPVDGTSGANQTIDLGPEVFPSLLLTESSGKFLYAQTSSGLLIYSIDSLTGALTLLNGPLPAFTFFKATTVADPMGPYLYAFGQAGVDVFQIDPQTGNLAEIPGAPFGTGFSGTLGSLGLAISGSPTQNIAGPAVELFPSSTSLGETSVGQTTATKIVSLVNTGDQTLAVNGISITGTNAGDFAQSSTCNATLAANANCSISLLFTPSQAGIEQATLQVTDNAPGSPHGAVIGGTGILATPSVTITPGNADFGTITEGTATVPQTVKIINSGTVALHVSAVALSGSNPGDFSQTNNCVSAAVAANGNCGITINFSAKAEGQRTASVTVTDDATNSPQSIQVSGTLASPFQLAAIPANATTATIQAGQIAQYMLQLNPGPGFSGTVALSCAGAPLGATCAVSAATIPISSANAVPFQVTVKTSGSALLVPVNISSPRLRIWSGPAVGLILAWMMVLLANRRSLRVRAVVIHSGWATLILSLLLFSASGCGGGSTASTVNPIVTPTGTTTLTVTAQSGALTPQTIQLTLTVK